MLKTLNIKTSKRTDMINITNQIIAIVKESGVNSGICVLHVPHTTAAITINESADPDVVYDILKKTTALIPENDNYSHAEGNSDAHIKSSIFGPVLTLIIENSNIVLGTWQNIYFCEFDGPRSRKLYAKII
ncbi:MAG: YjbQ family protein [Actinobacteria bacterium]|nr:YjbQ family protein [Actinomycetota bacterium]